MGDGEQVGGQVIRDLGIVEEYFHMLARQIVLEGRDIGGGWFGPVHHGNLETFVAHIEAERRGHQAEDRFGRGDRGAGEFGAQRGHSCVDGGKRG